MNVVDLGVCPIVVTDEKSAELAAQWAQAQAEAALQKQALA